MWRTAPLYAVFLGLGLYATNFTFTSGLGVLSALLVAFAVLDSIVLIRIQGIHNRSIETLAELRATRDQVERLSRFLLMGGGAFGALFVVAFVLVWLAS